MRMKGQMCPRSAFTNVDSPFCGIKSQEIEATFTKEEKEKKKDLVHNFFLVVLEFPFLMHFSLV